MNYEIKAKNYPRMIFCEYTKREAIKRYRERYGLKGKRVEISINRIGTII